MVEVDINLVNEFLKSEDLDGNELLMKRKCLETDAALKIAVQEKSRIVEQLNQLQNALAAKETDIVRLNGMQEGFVSVINDLVGQNKIKEQGE